MQETVDQSEDRDDRQRALRGGLDRDCDILRAARANQDFEPAGPYPLDVHETEFIVFGQFADDILHQAKNLTLEFCRSLDSAGFEIVEAQLRQQILHDIFKRLLRQIIPGAAAGQRLAGRCRTGHGTARAIEKPGIGNCEHRNLADRAIAEILEIGGVADDLLGFAIARHFDPQP
jgi:hypothetical protein